MAAQVPAALPIRLYAADIVAAVKFNNVVVVIGETGSGKTTQISQGAVTVAKRVAEERGVELGTLVGYAVRFEDRSSSSTKIKYLTDGTLLRECLEDPVLSRYQVLVLDEAHERSLNTDILFGVIKGLVKKRPDLKLVVTSATLDGEKFSAYFNDCPVFNVPGRCYPVDIIHSKQDHQKDYTAAAIDTVLQIHTGMPSGDILVFLTGQAEIDKAMARLNDAVSGLPSGSCTPLLVLPLYASLPPEMQLRVFRPGPPGVRRCVLATNVAETSVTVEGVVYVVDSGVVKQKAYNPATGMDSLEVVAISRVQATQRAGRAGRTRAGKCFRLYTKAFFEGQMCTAAPPEIQRTSLVSCVLYLKSLQLDVDVLAFDFLDRPAPGALEDALRQLYILEGINEDGAVTALGACMALLPLDPALSRALIAAGELGCLGAVLSVSAMLSTEHVFSGGQGPGDAGRQQGCEGKGGGHDQGGGSQAAAKLKVLMAEGFGDHVLLLRLWELWEQSGCTRAFCNEYGLDLRGMNFARDIRRQLQSVVGEDGSGLQKLRAADLEGAPRPGSCSYSRGAAASAGVTGSVVGGGNGGGGRPSDHKRGRGDEEPRGVPRAVQHVPGPADAHTVDAARHALTIGFANKLARRLRTHNGYRTLGTTSQLAQPHPSCAEMRADEDGLLPEWVIYHELVATSRPYLRQVCATRAQWVEPLLPRIMQVDVKRLSRSRAASVHNMLHEAHEAANRPADEVQAAAEAQKLVRRNDEGQVSAARERYLARRQQQGHL